MDDETCDEFVQRWVRLFRQQVRDRGPRVTWAGMARSPMRLPRRPADSPASPLQHIHIYRVPINNCFSIPKREKKKKERERKKKYDRSYARSIVRTSYRRTGEYRVHSRRRGSRDSFRLAFVPIVIFLLTRPRPLPPLLRVARAQCSSLPVFALLHCPSIACERANE